jgi:hypothetical protein
VSSPSSSQSGSVVPTSMDKKSPSTGHRCPNNSLNAMVTCKGTEMLSSMISQRLRPPGLTFLSLDTVTEHDAWRSGSYTVTMRRQA